MAFQTRKLPRIIRKYFEVIDLSLIQTLNSPTIRKISCKSSEAKYNKANETILYNFLESMKKLTSLILSLVLLLGNTSVFAQWLGDLFDTLWDTENFGYSISQQISIKDILEDRVIIQSPLVSKAGQNITNYTLMYSEFPLSEISEDTNLLKETKEKVINIDGNKNPFEVELGMSDQLNPIKKYYLFIIPKDSSGNIWDISNEIWFNIAEKTYGHAGSNEVHSFAEHNAPWADMTLANIRHEISGNTITLKWIAVSGSSKIDIAVMTPWASSFNKIATVNMDQERYSYIANRNGEYIFKFSPDNWGKEINYSANLNTAATQGSTDSSTSPAIPVVPKTGPTENIIAITIFAFLWYLIYKKAYRKSK